MTYLIFLLALAIFGFGISRSLVINHDKNGDTVVSFKYPRFVPYFLASVGIFVLFLAFTTVDAGQRGVVLRFGAVTGRTLQPGPHLVLPFAESVVNINVQTQIVKPDEQAASHDLQIVHVQVTMGYYTDPQYAGYIYNQLNNEAQAKVITPAILEAIKAVTARYDAEQLIASRAAVRDGIEDYVKQRLLPHHILVDSISITDFNFSEEYNKAIEEKVTAAQKVLTAQNDLSRIKIEAQQKIAAADGEAQALKAQKEQITPELLSLRAIEMMNKKWDGKLPTVMVSSQGALPMLDVLKAAQTQKKGQ